MEKTPELTDYFEKNIKKITVRKGTYVKGITLEDPAAGQSKMGFNRAKYLFNDLIKTGFTVKYDNQYLANDLILTYQEGSTTLKYIFTDAGANDRMNDALAASEHPITTNFK
ncbi:hypothetical protein [Loigolactobacillus rennini]|uniref:Uncharacterized protein n=1 Tax=Loigolactobacillus rennini DSM 20253 TaxID=1423796 RepID=A0A0R2CYB5_9LACO|nr:hypothetical protein [Loigolactobacillus rennini]KRM92780.1 hypothetical protein FC24_GL000947 [Loigolactobacillus rennini DSM 20253]